MSEKLKTKVVTPVFRVSFPKVFQAESYNGGPAQYSITMLFDKDDDIRSLTQAASNAVKNKWGDKPPKGLRKPFRDGDEKELEGYEGKIFVSARSKNKPGLVDGNLEPIIEEGEFYPGCYARASITAFAYDNIGKGVSFALNHIQKVEDGEAFGNYSKPEDDFGVIEGSESSDSDAAAGGDDSWI